MAWYDVFSLTYDRQLEGLYAPYRATAVDALRAEPGETVLDLACGTGQSLPALVAAVGPAGRVVGVDSSPGMLRRARRRAEAAGWGNVSLLHADASDVATLDLGVAEVDRLLVALGLTAMRDWRAVLARALSRVRPGGRAVVFDVFSERRGFRTRVVEAVARADLRRRVWEPLEPLCADFERTATGAPEATFGGTLYVACGTLPSTAS